MDDKAFPLGYETLEKSKFSQITGADKTFMNLTQLKYTDLSTPGSWH